MKKKLFIGIIAVFGLTIIAIFTLNFIRFEPIYKAEDNKIIVFDSRFNRELTSIDLTAKEGEFRIPLSPHVVQIAPNGQNIWVTASASQDQLSALHKNTKDHTHLLMTSDQVIIIDPTTKKIKERLQMGNNISISDIVFTQDSKFAYISAKSGNALYKINASTFKIDQMIELPPQTLPHEVAISTDNKKVYTKSSETNDIFVISTMTNKIISKMNSKDPLVKDIQWSNH